MADLAKVKRNIQRMIDQNAPEKDIDAYVASEGTTPEELQGAKANPQPVAAPAAQPSRNWADVPGEALQNIPNSAANFAQSLAQPIMHPMDTLNGINNLALGAIQQVPMLQDANSFLASHGMAHKRDLAAEASGAPVKTAQAFGGMMKDRYGSEEGWKKTLATDPVGSAADISMLLSGGGTALARAPGVAARVGSRALTTAAELTNPINAITKPAGLVGKLAANGVGLTTGAGGDAVMQAFRAGERGGTAGKDFRSNMRGNMPQDAVIADAKAALNKMVDDRRAEYNKGMAATKANKAVLDYTPVEDAMQKLTDTLFHGPVSTTDKASINLAKEVGNTINEWQTHFPNPTAEDFDRLKIKIDNLKPNWTQETGDQNRIIATMYNAVKSEILRKEPSYANTMKAYEESKATQTEIEKALSLGKKSSKDAALRKLQSVLRNNANTNYGSRADNIKKLEATGAAPNIMPKLAGQALNSLVPRGLSKLTSAAILGGGLANPMLWGTLPLTSPRLMGEAAHALGRGMGLVPKPPLSMFQVGRLGLLNNP